jgi:DNA-binding MarR family transcriptional regulator
VNRLYIQPKARKALERALAIGDELTDRVFDGFTAAERKQLIAQLGRAREGLLATAQEKTKA